MAQQCPEKRDTYYTQEVVLYESDFDHPDKLRIWDLEDSTFRQWQHKHSSQQNMFQLLH